jgi:hypothetical protein
MTTRKAAISLRKIPFLNSFLSWGSLRNLEAVARAAHGFEIARIFRVRFDLLPDTADVNIDGPRCHVGSVAPHRIQQMVAGKDATKVAGEVIEQAEFRGGGGNGLPANGQDHGGGVDGDISDFERTGWQGALKAAQHGLDAGYKFARTERLDDVVISADLEAEDAVGFAALGGEKNHRHRCEAGSLTHSAAKFKTVFARDHNIKHEKRRTLAFGFSDYSRAVGIDAHSEAIVLQMVANEAGNIGIVFDDEDAWFHGIIVAKAVPST